MAIFISGLVFHKQLDHKLANPLFYELAKTISVSKHNIHIALECVYECDYQDQLTSIVAESMPDNVKVDSKIPAVFYALLICLTKDNCHSKEVLIKNSNFRPDTYIPLNVSYINRIFKEAKCLEKMKFIGLHFVNSINSNSEWDTLAEALQTNTLLTKLELNRCKITEKAWEALLGALKNNTTCLQLTECNLSELENLKAITKLKDKEDPTQFYPGRKEWETFGEKKINVWYCEFNDKYWITLAEAMKTSKTQTHLNLMYCVVKEKGWNALIGVFNNNNPDSSTNTAFQQINLWQCNIYNRECHMEIQKMCVNSIEE